jgi:hypothetical protein
MSGVIESLTDKRLTQEIEEAKAYLDKLKLNTLKPDPRIEEILNLSDEDIQRSDQQICFQYAFQLNRYAAFIQTEENKWNSILYWAEHNLKIVIGKFGRDYGDKYTSYEERKNIVIVENEWAITLNKLVLETQLKAKSLYMVSNKINSMSKLLEGLAHAKKTSNY